MLEGRIFDGEGTRIENCATGAQAPAAAAITPIPALDVEVFDVNVLQDQISSTRGKASIVHRANRKQSRIAGDRANVPPLQRCSVTLDSDI